MDRDVVIGLTAIIAILVGGIVLRALVLRLVFPLRVILFDRANDILDSPDLRETEREFVNHLLDTYDSFDSGWIVPSALWRSIVRERARAPIRRHRFRDIHYTSQPLPTLERPASLVLPYCVSVLAANPIAILATIALLVPFFIVAAVRWHEAPKAAIKDAAQEFAAGRGSFAPQMR